MKYKVFGTIPGSSLDGGFNFTFYTKNQAIAFAESYVNITSSAYCWVWDGSQMIRFPS